MTAQHRLGLALAWPPITVVFLIDVAVLAVASHCPDSWQTHHIAWWVGVGLAVVVTALGLLTYRGITLPSAVAAWVRDWFADPAATLTAGCTPAIDYRRRFGRDVVGVRAYRGRLVTVVAVASRDDSRSRPGALASAALPVAAVAAGLHQFDVHLDGIDIVSAGVRQTASAADEGEPVSLDRHDTWLVLRMNPQRNVAAVAARDSLAATLVAVTERLAHNLDARRYSARPLTAEELVEVDNGVLAGLQPTWRRPGWRQLNQVDGCATSFWVSPHDITSETLDRLWLADADATVVTIRLTTRRGRPEVSAWVRYHSGAPLHRNEWPGLNRLTARQLAAVRASLPAPTTRPLLVVPARELGQHEELAAPLGRAPQYATSSPAGQ